MVGLKSIKLEAGPEWRDFPDQVRKIAENEIARALGPQDLYRAYDSDNFALCFVNLDEKAAKAKSRQIAEAIKARIKLARPDGAQPISVNRFISEVATEDFDGMGGSLGEALVGIMATSKC